VVNEVFLQKHILTLAGMTEWNNCYSH